MGIFEVMRLSDRMRAMLIEPDGATHLREQALREGMVTLVKDGMFKAKAGHTNPAEVLRNAYITE
jgi:general secretion pathway protein E